MLWCGVTPAGAGVFPTGGVEGRVIASLIRSRPPPQFLPAISPARARRRP